MPKHGKKYRLSQENIPAGVTFAPPEAVRLVKELAFATFDETVEVSTRLSVDGDAAVVVESGPDAWLDEVNVNQQLDAGESQGNFPMAATATFGDGRLMVMADSPFDDIMLEVYRNDPGLHPNPAEWITDVYIPVRRVPVQIDTP